MQKQNLIFVSREKNIFGEGKTTPPSPSPPTRKVNGQSLTETNVFHLKSIKRVTISGSPKVRYS
jgi:hypothetical protein